jgi:hypothetical protein
VIHGQAPAPHVRQPWAAISPDQCPDWCTDHQVSSSLCSEGVESLHRRTAEAGGHGIIVEQVCASPRRLLVWWDEGRGEVSLSDASAFTLAPVAAVDAVEATR